MQVEELSFDQTSWVVGALGLESTLLRLHEEHNAPEREEDDDQERYWLTPVGVIAGALLRLGADIDLEDTGTRSALADLDRQLKAVYLREFHVDALCGLGLIERNAEEVGDDE